MMVLIEQFFDYFLFSFELLAGIFFFSLPFDKKKKRFWLSLLLSFVSTIGISILLCLIFYDLMTNNIALYDQISFIAFFLLVLPPLGFLVFGYNTTVWNKVFIFIANTFTRNIAKKSYYIIRFLIGFLDVSNPSYYSHQGIPKIWLLIYYPLLILCYSVMTYYLHRVFKHAKTFKLNPQVIGLFSILLVINFLINPAERIIGSYDKLSYGMLLVADFAYSSLVFLLLFILMNYAEKQLESSMLAKMMNDSQKEYQIIKENIDIINLKCHDLRHQLRAAKLSGNMDENFVNETLKSIDIYDCQTKTGNETLDILLMDHKLHCLAHKIQFTAVTDGKAIDFMAKEDIISLFSNILENAINYETLVINEEERFISLIVKQKNDFVIIQQENSLSNNVKPQSRKDKNYHGYGLLSIANIAKKYNGNVQIKNKSRTYKISVVLVKK